MKKMRKILSLALAVIMMMAMSITAFADEQTTTANTATVTVTNLKEGVAVNIYKIAGVTNNEITVETWAKYPLEASSASNDIVSREMTATEVSELKEAFAENKPSAVKPEAKANAKGEVSFTNLDAGVYYIVATSNSNAIYSPMVAVAVKNVNGTYVANTPDAIVAKGTGNDLDKVASDYLVQEGQSVDFTITKTIPSYANKFLVYDYTEGLSSLANVTAKVSYGNVKDAEFTFAPKKDDKGNVIENAFVLDLTSIVYDSEHDAFKNENKGDELTIKYSATVVGADGYKNDASFKVNDNDETDTIEIIGRSGDITLTKYSVDEKNEDGTQKVLSGAEFTVTKKATATTAAKDLKFVLVSTGVYRLAETTDAEKDITDTVIATNGTVKITGLDEGEYHFTETKAPAGYAVNVNGANAKIDEANLLSTTKTAELTAEQKATISVTTFVNDSRLASLPFTGGMGTTIFTVLGVAIMAIAAALFFASKRKASK